ncbi:MAG: molybdenum cofactor biosynthesis protein MoaE [Thermoplasmata archaeon]|nr:molybdenum cofactor biosynthesis protein MoaE [Thermoplasmata archaeon]MCI4356798.1 molybdenum cofactor biosynthesis protein MoaE [Thermoplasmata archaeon]
MSVRISPRPLDLDQATRELGRRDAGAVVVFAGIVRPDSTPAGKVRALFYEADSVMVRKSLARIARETLARPGVQRVVLWHRTGLLAVGEVSVVVGAAAGHRAQAFSAARRLIEAVKRDAPIWKTDRLWSPPPRRRPPSPPRGSRSTGRARRTGAARR